MPFHRIRVYVLGVAWNSKLVLSMFASTFRNVVESLIVTKYVFWSFFWQNDLILVLIQHALFVTDSPFLVFRAASVLAVEFIT
jgi:hypothetical protein